MKLRKIAATLALTTALTMPMQAGAQDSSQDWSDINILVLHWSQASNPFFGVVNAGVTDAAEDQGVTVDIQFGEEDPVTTSNILETAIANEVDAIALGLADDNAYGSSARSPGCASCKSRRPDRPHHSSSAS